MSDQQLSEDLIGIAQEEFDARQSSQQPDVVIDVRRVSDFLSDPAMMPRARRGDPDALDEWARALPKDRDIVVYCVRGGSVSQSIAPQLVERGLRARYLVGGLVGWKERGGKTKLQS